MELRLGLPHGLLCNLGGWDSCHLIGRLHAEEVGLPRAQGDGVSNKTSIPFPSSLMLYSSRVAPEKQPPSYKKV